LISSPPGRLGPIRLAGATVASERTISIPDTPTPAKNPAPTTAGHPADPT
jgi:hypothetical protein